MRVGVGQQAHFATSAPLGRAPGGGKACAGSTPQFRGRQPARGRARASEGGDAPGAAFLRQLAEALQQATGAPPAGHGASVSVRGVAFHPPGAARPLLTGVSLDLPADSLSVLSGPSGAGKTTLLHVLAGLSEATAGTILLGGAAAPRPASPAPAAAPARLRASGVVFQFPERHFLGSTLVEELTLGWPETGPGRTRLAQRAQQVLAAVGLSSTPLQARLSSLSDGYKRRVALAVQLIQQPRLLLLDEPLAGLDWMARRDLLTLLQKLKGQCTMLVVSHEIAELTPLADAVWRLADGGRGAYRLDQSAITALKLTSGADQP
uniref:ABC transporter domain-containing protein n=1 Tax=Auxenochlorella protothecoides TaxID=3075 RepID=A0A1D2A0S0_AUXPR